MTPYNSRAPLFTSQKGTRDQRPETRDQGQEVKGFDALQHACAPFHLPKQEPGTRDQRPETRARRRKGLTPYNSRAPLFTSQNGTRDQRPEIRHRRARKPETRTRKGNGAGVVVSSVCVLTVTGPYYWQNWGPCYWGRQKRWLTPRSRERSEYLSLELPMPLSVRRELRRPRRRVRGLGGSRGGEWGPLYTQRIHTKRP